MSDSERFAQNADKQAAVASAAHELASRLASLAGVLADKAKPQRVPFGPGRVGKYMRRQSPEGFVLDPVALKLLLPDGRVWSYSRAESTQFPDGRTFDARADYSEFAGGRSFPSGREFIFLGAVLDKYSFGWAAPSETDGESDPAGLCAIYAEGRSVRWVSADDAFTVLTGSAIGRLGLTV